MRVFAVRTLTFTDSGTGLHSSPMNRSIVYSHACSDIPSRLVLHYLRETRRF